LALLTPASVTAYLLESVLQKMTISSGLAGITPATSAVAER